MKSTTKGKLNEIYQCYINIGSETITLNNLPDISLQPRRHYWKIIPSLYLFAFSR